jgi:glutamine synthetase
VAVADGLAELAGWIAADGGSDAVMKAVRRAMQESAPVRFDGNGYSADWVVEAEGRGLPHARNTPAALAALHTPAAEGLFTRHGVLTADELHARYEVRLEQYNKKVDIEADVLRAMVDTAVLPAALGELGTVAGQEAQIRALGSRSAAAESRRLVLTDLVDGLHEARQRLDATLAAVPEGEQARAEAACASVVPAMQALREASDALEDVLSDAAWPVPRYREMLYLL